MGLRQYLRDRVVTNAEAKLIKQLRAKYTRLTVLPEQGLFNKNCHCNCIEWLRCHPGESLDIAEVIYFTSDGDSVLHYLIYDSKKGDYYDVTLGWKATYLEYYLIRIIHPDDHHYIAANFNDNCDTWLEEYVGWFGRKILGIKRIV
jgi:hypothetical protein